MLVHKSKLSAYTVYLIYSGITSLSFSLIFTVNLVYQVETARLNPLQLVLVGTVLVRATVISMRGQVDAFGQTVGGPPVGFIGNAFSIRAALLASGALLSPVLLLYTYAARKIKKR